MNHAGLLLKTKAQHADAEPLYRRVLAIDEQSLGTDHPNVAIRLSNLAQLLQDTNRLDEAEPLMRRHVVILLEFGRRTGHAHPHLQAAFANYEELRTAQGRTETEIWGELEALQGGGD